MKPCSINPSSNRTCERGTPRCEIHHTDASPPAESLWLHKKTGGLYRIRCVARMTDAFLTPIVVYERAMTPGEFYARPADEFHDGRFEEVPG